MEDHLRSLVQLLFVTPCFVLALRWYRLQRKEPDKYVRTWQRLGVLWAMVVFVVISLAGNCLWTRWVTGP